jgi:quercetin dioxygenase-like cupin family protein
MDDRDLNRLLHAWTAPDAPPHLRPPRGRGSRLRWLITGTIPLPVPAALAAVLLLAVWIGAAWPKPRPDAQTSTSRRSGELARHPLTGPLEGFDAVAVEVNFEPGAAAAEHRHPGPILGYVVGGRMRFGVNNEQETVVPTGGTFFEPAGALHTAFGSASPDAPARAVVFLLVPSGSGLTGSPSDTRERSDQ